MKRVMLLTLSHVAVLAIGFAAGIYVLPIVTAAQGPALAELQSLQRHARFKGEFRRDLKGSDLLHWGEGTVSLDSNAISFMGRLAPGPDYKLYLVAGPVESREAFLKVKPSALRVGDIKSFDNFIVPLPQNVDLSRYETVLVWCETFSMFITAAKYR